MYFIGELHMIENIRIAPCKALPETVITDLGRTNVISGRNNSGKLFAKTQRVFVE